MIEFFQSTANVFGLADAILIIGIIYLWWELNKEKKRNYYLMKSQLKEKDDMIKNYNDFKNTLRDLERALVNIGMHMGGRNG